MKRTVLTLLFICFIYVAHAQENVLTTISKERIEIGKSTISGQIITGEKISFGTPVYKIQYDSISSQMLVQLRRMDKKKSRYKRDGVFLVCDSSFLKPHWQETIESFYGNNQFRICHPTNSILIESGVEQSFGIEKNYFGTGCYSLEYGMKFWHSGSMNNAFEHPEKAVGICQGTSSGVWSKSPVFKGVDLTNGKKTWTRVIKFFSPIIHYETFNDSTVLALSGGLHTMNLNTGKGWDVDMQMNNKGYMSASVKSSLSAATGGGALGAIGMMVAFPGSAKVPSSTFSNILMTDSVIYLAGKNQIICCKKQTGEVIWSDTLQEKQTSSSQLLLKDNKLIMINYGCSTNDEGEKVNYGEPFVAAYNPKSGNLYFMENLMDETAGPIADFCIDNSRINLLFSHKIAILSLNDGKLINEVTYPEEKFGSLCSFSVKDKLFISENNQNISTITDLYKNKLIIKSLKEDWITANLDGVMDEDTITASKIWTKTGDCYGYTVLQNQGSKTCALLFDGKVTAYLNVDNFFFIADKWLYALQNHELIRVKLN